MTRLNTGGEPVDWAQLASMYLTAKEAVIEAGFADEIDWQEETSLDDLDEQTFLRESAWVVLSAGFRETILRSRFPEVSRAFLYWSSADSIVAERATCRTRALVAFGNTRKIDAIVSIVERVFVEGFDSIQRNVIDQGVHFLQELPFIGPVTSCHLAKNLGIAMVKSDRHLARMASRAGFDSADQMCKAISSIVGDSLSVVDIVIWRYATIGGTLGWDQRLPLDVNRTNDV